MMRQRQLQSRPDRHLVLALVLAAMAASPLAADVIAPAPVVPCSLPLPLALSADQCRQLAAGEPIVEGRRVEGYAYAEAFGLVAIEVSAEQLWQVVIAADAYDEFLPHVVESRLEQTEDGRLLHHQRLALPLLRDRHMTVELLPRQAEDGGGAFSELAWDYVEGSGNIVSTRGSWTVRALAPGRSLLVYRALTDPGVALPRWVVEMAGRRSFHKLLVRVRQRATTLFGSAPPIADEAGR